MPEWYEGLDADLLAHVTEKGWNQPLSPEIMVKTATAHRNAEKMIGWPADRIARIPKDAADPEYQTLYERIAGLGTPKDPAEYKFDGVKFKDGSDLEQSDQEFVRALAAELKLPVHAARAIAARMADRADAIMADQATGAQTNKQMNDAAIRANWGTEYDQKQFSATRAAEAVGFTAEVLTAMGNLPPEKYVANMNALVLLGAQMNEAAMLRGGRAPTDATAGMTPAQARARIDELKQDQRWLNQFASGDAAAHQLVDRLTRIMVGAPAA